MNDADIIIVGAGIVGLTCAALLAQQTSLRIIIIDNKDHAAVWDKDRIDLRVSAISLGSKKILQAIKVWDDIIDARYAQFSMIKVYDTDGQSALSFDSREIGKNTLGYIVENNLIVEKLLAHIKRIPQIAYRPGTNLTNISHAKNHIELTANQYECFRASLIIAADGAKSWVRNQAHIDVTVKDYHQHAIVAHVKTAQPHGNVARQIFLPLGPLAFLPLHQDKLCSIVWSTSTEDAHNIQKLNDEEFKALLSQQFPFLGKITETTKRVGFPLSRQLAKRYIAERIVLIGDAAHVIHPLAGQGANLGLQDAACLVDVIVQTIKEHKPIHTTRNLRCYERSRKAKNAEMIAVIEAVKFLFQDNKVLNPVRKLGLTVTASLAPLKALLIAEAVGA